jgi:type IX secretion system PorP/SprF family membrane protein
MKIALYAVLLLLTSVSIGQSIINKNLYTSNMVHINPAYLGNQGKMFISFQSSLSGQNDLALPTYTSLTVHGVPMRNVGVGSTFLSETQGAFSLTMADVGASYEVKDQIQSLRFGMTVGFIKQSLNSSQIDINGQVNPTDPYLNPDLYNQSSIKLGAGIVYEHGDWEVGVGSPFLFRGGQSINKEVILNAGYTWELPNKKFKINPSAIYQVRDKDLDLYDFNLKGIYLDKVWVLTGYRSNSSLNFSFGFIKDIFEVSYNFNAAQPRLNTLYTSNHELLLALVFDRNKGRKYGHYPQR